MKRWCLVLLATVLAFAPMLTTAQTIDVLWYAYSPPGAESQYREQMQQLAAAAADYPAGSGLQWEVTFFGPGDPAPDFAAFDVLVTQSSLFASGDDVFGSIYAGILDNQAAIEAARGSRTLITGLDPDFHYIFDGPVDDGPRGTLVNFINWAGSGTGLGIVALDAEDFQWWTAINSFLRDEVLGFTIGDCCGGQFIPDFAADYPINAGLTDAGVVRSSGGATHTGFDLAMPGYVAIHQSIGNEDELTGTTMVTAAEASGATTPQVQAYQCEGLLPPLHHPMTLPASSRAKIPVRMRLLDATGEPVTADDLSQAPLAQLRFGSRTRTLGSFAYQQGSDVWTFRLDSRQLREAGSHTIEAVAGDGSYDVQLCEQTIRRR